MTRKSNRDQRLRQKDAQEQRAKGRTNSRSGVQEHRPRVHRSTTTAPNELMGGIIGKGGVGIKALVEEAGPSCRIWSDKTKAGTFNITALDAETIAAAKLLISQKVTELQAKLLERGFIQNQRGSIQERRRSKGKGKVAATMNIGTTAAPATFQMDKEQFPKPATAVKKKRAAPTAPSSFGGSFAALGGESDSGSDVESDTEPTPTHRPTGDWVKPLDLSQKPEPVETKKPVPPPALTRQSTTHKHLPTRSCDSPLHRKLPAPSSSWYNSDEEEDEDGWNTTQFPGLEASSVPTDTSAFA